MSKYKKEYGQPIPTNKKFISEWCNEFKFILYNNQLDVIVDLCELAYLINNDYVKYSLDIKNENNYEIGQEYEYKLEELYSYIIINATREEREELQEKYICTNFCMDLLQGRMV